MATPRPLANAIVLALLAWIGAVPSRGQADGDSVPCAIHRRLHSRLLQEDRSLLIRLPSDYGAREKKYPVLFKLDGSRATLLQTIGVVEYLVDHVDGFPDPIVVGIENTDRNRDMLPGKGAGLMARFLKSELIPFIDESYSTNGSRILCGQSLSSVFALYSLLKEPDAFDAYVLSSFGLSAEWLSLFQEELARSTAPAKWKSRLYVANGKLDPYDPDGARARNGVVFLDSLRKAAPDVVIKERVYEGEGHVPYPAVYDALKWLYGPGDHLGQ